MRLLTLWATRRGSDEPFPELLVAWDFGSYDAYPEGFDDECAKALGAMGDDVLAWRRVDLEADGKAILAAFDVPTIAAKLR